MCRDVADGHLHYLKTDNAFGATKGSRNLQHHNLLRYSGVELEGHHLRLNDVFRITHDCFGHAMFGHQFGPHGEERAWRSHMTMYCKTATPALTTETRAQNCWVNFGPHMRLANGKLRTEGMEGFLPLKDRPFPPQKTLAMPDHCLIAPV
jgi:hypothetical protein